MKLLFLDIDGVMNTVETRKADNYYLPTGFSDIAVKQLFRIIKETNCSIVLSSTWRNSTIAFDPLKKWFEDNNIPFIGTTPTIGHTLGSDKRGAEIIAWMKGKKPIDSFVVLDDAIHGLNEVKHQLVSTNDEEGLTVQLADKVIEMLNK